MGTDWSPVGQIYFFTLKSTNPRYDVMELKALEDWVIERQFKSVPNVVDVASFGGVTKEYQVRVDPNKLVAYGLSIGQVEQQLASNNANAGGFSLALHAPSTYSGGTNITRQSVDAYATNALGTGSVVIQANNASVNVEHLGIAGGITLPNAITIQQGNPGAGNGAIQYLNTTGGNSTLTGAITVQADKFTGGTFAQRSPRGIEIGTDARMSVGDSDLDPTIRETDQHRVAIGKPVDERMGT